MGAGQPGPVSPPCPVQPLLAWQTDPSSGPGLIPGQGPQGPQGDCAPGPSLAGPTAFLALPWPGEAPSTGPELGETDKCDKDDKDGRSSWRDGHLTYQVALQEGLGRGEERRDRERKNV